MGTPDGGIRYRGVAQLVARLVRDQEVGCSSHLTPTNSGKSCKCRVFGTCRAFSLSKNLLYQSREKHDLAWFRMVLVDTKVDTYFSSNKSITLASIALTSSNCSDMLSSNSAACFSLAAFTSLCADCSRFRIRQVTFPASPNPFGCEDYPFRL